MRNAFGFAAICAVFTAPAAAEVSRFNPSAGPQLLEQDFDLATASDRRHVSSVPAERAMALMPREPNKGAPDFTPPAMAVELAEDGPVLAVGAIGAKFKDAPRLAHVAIGMDF